MDALECLLGRRSIRKFTPDPLPEGDLQRILEAVRFAPTWANTQCHELVVVRAIETRRALVETLTGTNPAREGLLQAPAVIALCARTKRAGFKKGEPLTQYGDWCLFDAGIASQNLCLAAWALGYGTVHVGLLDHARAGKILGLPADVVLLELIPVGRPAQSPAAPARRPQSEFVHQEKF